MAKRGANKKTLNRVAKLKSAELDLLREGESVTSRTGYSLEELFRRTITDRVKTAQGHLNTAKACMQLTPKRYRTAVSRGYYSLYQAFRAVHSDERRGDDNESHKNIQEKLPDSFPDQARWKNELKLARLARNSADYDPYPLGEREFKSEAIRVLATATKGLVEVRAHLRSKGYKI